MTDGRIDLSAHVRDIPDFPKEGILFRDIMPLLQDPAPCARPSTASSSTAPASTSTWSWERRRAASSSAPPWPTASAPASSARASPASCPHDTVSAEYDLEYGTDKLEVHADAIKPGQNVLVHDDLLATGGTARAKIELVEKLGGKVVGVAFIIELVRPRRPQEARRLRRLQPDHVLTRRRTAPRRRPPDNAPLAAAARTPVRRPRSRAVCRTPSRVLV